MTFRELTKEEFNEFSHNHSNSSLYQTIEYATFMVKEGYNYYAVGLVDYETVRAATLVFFKNNKLKYGYIPNGFLIDYNNPELVNYFIKELKRFLSKKDIVAVKFNPRIIKNIYDSKYIIKETNNEAQYLMNILKHNSCTHLGYNQNFESLLPRFESIISLEKDKYEHFSNLSKHFRTKARSAETRGVRIYKGNNSDIEELYKELDIKKHPLTWYQNVLDSFGDSVSIFYAKLDTSAYLKLCQTNYLSQEKRNDVLNDQVMNNRGRSHEKLLDKKMSADIKLGDYHQYLDEAIKLHSKYKDGIMLGFAIVITHNDTINILDLSYNKEYTNYNASHLLIWKLIEKYSENNYKIINLGGMTSNDTTKFKGLNKFKLGFGSNVYEYIGDYELISNYPKYLVYRNGLSLFK